MSDSANLPTFCHINEYNLKGYRDLRCMVASSDPLYLWGPSSVLLKHPRCSITPGDFIKYVKKGNIRIVARRDWLLSRESRNRHPWTDGAPWNDDIDGVIKSICLNDETSSPSDRRVLVAPPEEGLDWAARYVDEHPEQIRKWNRVISRNDAHRKVPIGTLETARRNVCDPRKAAISILRDAYNHGQAARFAHPDSMTFLMSSADREFARTLGSARLTANILGGQLPDGGQHEPRSTVSQRRLEECTLQVLELLRRMDSEAGPRSLNQFMRSSAHSDLVKWLRSVRDDIEKRGLQKVDNLVVEKIKGQVEAGEFPIGVREWLSHPMATTVSASGLAITIASTAVDPANALGLAGLSISALTTAGGLGKMVGLMPATYTGPQWPFLYMYGKSASIRRQKEMLAMLAAAAADS